MPTMHPIYHYAGVAVLMLAAYFLIVAPLVGALERRQFVPNAISVSQPTPAPQARAAEIIAQALKDKALADAIAGRAADLSLGQSTIANTIAQATGINSRLAAALAEGLTRPSPKVQVIDIATKATSTVTPPPIIQTDDAIKRDLKEVLAETTIKTDVKTSVNVRWEDKPLGPIFAVYGSDGSSGIGFRLHHTRLLDLDALGLTHNKKLEPGLGVDHTFKGTSASIGVGVAYDFGSKAVKPMVFVGIKF